jgi:integrase
MYAIIKIYCPKDTTKRSYIYYRDGAKKVKHYNGKILGVYCYPNQSLDYRERYAKLQYLASLFNEWILKGGQPQKDIEPITTFFTAIEAAKLIIDKSNYSITYKRDLYSVLKDFRTYLKLNNHLKLDIECVPTNILQDFLNQFQSSGTYYMNKRRNLASIFSKLVECGYLKSNPVIKTNKKRSLATLHKAYTEEQLLSILNIIKGQSPNLYLCVLLMYSSLLRPHQEIRNLKRGDFSEDLTYVFLSGCRNKSGRVRKIPTTGHIRNQLIEMGINSLAPDHNIFSKSLNSPNPSYFSLMWSRTKEKLIDLELINKEHTLYSFRHSAAIAIYKKSKDIALLKELLGHSSITVSLIYLRNLEWGDMLKEDNLPKIK